MKSRLFQISMVFLLLAALLLSACEPLGFPPAQILEPIEPSPLAQPTSALTEETIALTPLPTDTPTPTGPLVWINPDLPGGIKNLLPGDLDLVLTDERTEADFWIDFTAEQASGEWIYALAAPFATLTDNVSSDQFAQFWAENAEFAAGILVMSQSTYAAMVSKFGEPQASVKILPESEILDYCWNSRDPLSYDWSSRENWAVIPFEMIQPRWKVISLDDNSPLRNNFDQENYALSIAYGWSVNQERTVSEAALQAFQQVSENLPHTNRDADLITSVMLTGVTALTRATGKEMELYGVLSPAESIGELMREADIAHVSNEVPFARDCPPPQWVQEVDLVFCSDDKYIDLLREIGTDVVELTGDHFGDWGPQAMLHTLEMYQNEGWPYYGGGKDIEEARSPIKLTHNDNKIAFIGCNGKSPGYATASEFNPGAFHCDMDFMVSEIQALVSQGYQVIATFQHWEIYDWQPSPQMIIDFQRVADAGAVIVSGSQAHQPQLAEFYSDSFIHYGLGNLFFDQLGWFDDSDKAFLDRHVFYDGKYLGVELITVQFFNWSTPTLMAPEAREILLDRFFIASGWK